MGKDELVDARVSLNQCKKAVEALHSHETKKQQKLDENELLPGKEQNIWLNVTVKRIPAGHRFKPCKIPVVHPLVDPRTTPVCLLTKDPQREYKDLLEAHGIKFISRVVGVEKLKGKFKPYEARRMLLKENGLFLADERIIPILPKLLGSKWFEAKKQPIPVCLTRKDLKGELERAISSTYMNQNQGTYTSVKIANLSHKPAQILANIKTALPAIAKNIHGGWDNIQSFNIKTNSSMSLPIWSCSLDDAEGGRWDGFAPESDAEDSAEGSDEDMEADEEAKKAAQDKGKKRTSIDDEDDVEAEKPRKKAKGILPPAAASSISKALPEASVSIPTPPTSSVTAGEANADASSKSKKLKAKPTSSTPSQPSPTAAATPTAEPIPAGKKGKTSKAATSAISASLPEAEPAPTTAAPAVDAAKPKKRKGKKDTVPAAPTLLEIQPAPTTATHAVDAAQPKKRKAKKDAVPAAAAVPETQPAPITVSQTDLKQKRSAASGEKKKDKVVKGKGGKSAKDGVLGKKAAQV
ncbi:ribosomal protein L1p/L10e family-domain-containing protein [Crucibulum laeve]|uniref:Ribosomal L1 domain-containing protein 1 n=1 Tax=Crucibulum laeve TaxID=68775 RepID=A0A5C3M1R3_9AGAR|nr:ribosomal protein L1p/L10e family-domain-containing protein [Crucibulum laeve]